MNPAPEPASIPIAKAERIQFLLSRQIDGDLNQEETAELAASQWSDIDSARQAAFADLRSMLQALPVRSVGQSFATNVQNAIQHRSLTVTADPLPLRPRGWMTGGIVAVSIASCIAALVLMTRFQNLGPSADQLTQTPGSATAKSMSAEIAVASASTEAEAQEAVPNQKYLRPFLETDDWRIVVVKVCSKDREEVMRDIEALVAKNGMNIQPIASNNNHDARFGILFTSASVDDKAFVENILPQTDAQSADWNAQSVAESTRESIIQRVQESLKIPTHSEIHFGQVYVALPKTASLPDADAPAADQPLVAKNPAIAAAVNPSPSAQELTDLTGTVRSVPSVLEVPVLVVFEFITDVTDRI